jgi:small subunit ribosomal protein S17
MADDKKTKEEEAKKPAPEKKDEAKKPAPTKKDEPKAAADKSAPALKPASKGEAKKELSKKPVPKKAAPKKETAPKKPAKKAKPPRKPIPKGMDIGIDVELPKNECDDQFCPFHGSFPVRGQILEGIVVSDRMQRSVVVKREYMRLNKKYERLEKRSGKYLAHSPPCLETKTGDRVRIMECRPLSKTISYVVIEKRTGE